VVATQPLNNHHFGLLNDAYALKDKHHYNKQYQEQEKPES